MNRKKIPLIKTSALVFSLIYVAATSVACSSKNILPETQDSIPLVAYDTRAEGAAIAPAVNPLPRDVSMGAALPAKGFPVATISEEDVKIKKDQAIEIAKAMLEDPTLYAAGNAYLNPMYGIYGASGASWMIDFSEKASTNINVNVTIDANSGKIIGFNSWKADDSQQVSKEPMTREEAVVIAEKMLKDRFDILLENYEIQKEDLSVAYLKMPDMGGTRIYSFNYTRVVNGVLFPFETVNISIDGVSGELRNYYHNDSQFDFTKLPSKDSVISPQQALEHYRNAVAMSLQYITLYQEKPKAVLVYAPTNYLNMLDAFSGKPLSYDGLPYSLSADVFGQLVPMGANVQIETKAISEKEAQALADKYRKMAQNLYGVTFENTAAYSERYQQTFEDIWNASWYKNDEKYSYSFYISINLKTGHIVNLSMSKYENGGIMPMETEKGNVVTDIAAPDQPMPNTAPAAPAQEPATMPAPGFVQEPVNEKINWAEGKEKAIAFLKEMLPETYGFYADINHEQPTFTDDTMKYVREHSYGFVRMVNGIAYRENSINVSVDRETGEIKNLNVNWSDLEFQKPNGVIGAESAEDKYFGDMEARLSYHLITAYDYNTGTITDVKPVLVYNFTGKTSPYAPNQYVDAFTGESVGDNYMLMRSSVPSSYAK